MPNKLNPQNPIGPTTADTVNAAKTLMGSLKVNGGSLLTYLVLAVTTISPVIVQQVGQTRAPGGNTHLAQAEFHIMGPDLANPGELVRLTVDGYDPTDVVWFWADTQGVTFDGQEYGARSADVVFAMPATPAVITCSILRDGELYLTTKTVQLPPEDEVAPVEPVKPTPTPKPDPVKPAVLSDIGASMRDIAVKHAVPIDVAILFAKNLRSAVDKMGEKTPRALLTETARLNKEIALSEEAEDSLKVMLQALAEEGALSSMERHVEVWLELANGLDAYINR